MAMVFDQILYARLASLWNTIYLNEVYLQTMMPATDLVAGITALKW
jgi:hypothetical protein